MKSEGSREDVEFSLEELFKVGNIRLSVADYPPLQEATTNLKRIVTPGDLITDLAQKIADHMGLTFISEINQDGNVCMAESSEVIPQFREICTGTDILNFVIATINSDEKSEELKNKEKINSIRIAFPQDAIKFWEQVEAGSRLKMTLYKD